MLGDAVTSADVANVVSRATGIPIQALMSGERDKLLHIEERLSERVIGQAEAVKAVSNAIRLTRAGMATCPRRRAACASDALRAHGLSHRAPDVPQA